MHSYLALLLVLVPAVYPQLPDGWKTCSRSAPDYNECFNREVAAVCRKLMNGDKKLGSPPIDPLRLTKVQIPKLNAPVSIDLTFTDLEITGGKNFEMENFKNDWKTMTGVFRLPYLNVQGNYKVDGKVLILPIVGQGKCNFTFDNVDVDIDAAYKQIQKGGKKYFYMEKYGTNIHAKKLYIHLDNLFNGDKALGDNTNLFLNENWEQIFEEIKPALSEGLSQAFTQISNIVLSKIPSDLIDIP